MKMRNKKKIYVIFYVLLGLGIFALPCEAITLLTEKEALETMFRHEDQVVEESVSLSPGQVEQVKKRLGGRWAEYRKGGRAVELIGQKSFLVYFGVSSGRKEGAALILEEPGKWGPIEYIVCLNLDATVRMVAVMRYTETRGRPIARGSFLGQFLGKRSSDPLEIGRDIHAISGATISSKATAFVVKRALALYEVGVLRKS